MSSAVNDDDFDFNSDDNDWGDDEDVDIVDDSTKILQLSRQDSMEKENTNTCWKCTHCKNINNVNLTIEKEDMQCCGCKQTHYIPDETETFQCSKPHTHNDYLLRIGVLKKITVWICDQCTFKNENIHSESCEICQSKRNPLALITTTLTENTNENTENESINSNTNNSDNKYTQDTYNHNYIYIDTYSDNEYYDNDITPTPHTINNTPRPASDNINDTDIIYVGPEWQCCHCTATNTSKSECKHCGCRKPIKFSNISLSELLPIGYIRQFANSLNTLNSNVNLPQVICKLCHRFYGNNIGPNNNGFKNKIIFPISGGAVTHMSKPIEPLKQTFLCVTDRYYFNIFGEQCTDINNGYRIYRWRVKLKIDRVLCPIGNVKIDGNGISIGIASDDASKFCGTGNIFKDYQFAYGVDGNGRYTIYSQFCPPFKENDIITLEFDSNKQTLSYGINDKWFGISHRGIQKDNLRLCVCVKQKGVEIECIGVDVL